MLCVRAFCAGRPTIFPSSLHFPNHIQYTIRIQESYGKSARVKFPIRLPTFEYSVQATTTSVKITMKTFPSSLSAFVNFHPFLGWRNKCCNACLTVWESTEQFSSSDIDTIWALVQHTIQTSSSRYLYNFLGRNTCEISHVYSSCQRI